MKKGTKKNIEALKQLTSEQKTKLYMETMDPIYLLNPDNVIKKLF